MTRNANYEAITPNLNYLSDQAVIVQAWKKAHAHIRYHNWFADSLELDASALRLRQLVENWSTLLKAGTFSHYAPDPMRLVPAPKSGVWQIKDGWKPVGEDEPRLRPLAHLTIRDQSLSMAALICLADLVETAQGDPTTPVTAANRKKVVSYGHRLVCSWRKGRAMFRWGNDKLYRQYFTDYQQFVHRPERIRQALFPEGDSWAIVQLDLTQFYDRIPRQNLIQRLERLARAMLGKGNTDARFFTALERVFAWTWHAADVQRAQEVCANTDGSGIPQGLAVSGFFANAYLLNFDKQVIALVDKRLKGHKWQIVDYCRYVDDMRFVIRLDGNDSSAFVADFSKFIQDLLDKKAKGLLLNQKKTQVMYGNRDSPNVPVADAMQAVNNNVSGPLDVETARHALEMLDGLLAVSNSRRAQIGPTGTAQDDMLRKILSVEPDVRNDTLERFIAHRWRRVYRSLRVMADADGLTDTTLNVGRKLLDQRAMAFAVELLRKWILDPSHVRLLRVSLDLFPSPDHLTVVLNLLRSYLSAPSGPPRIRLVCEYVAAEVLRAGATETGFVRDSDELPDGVDVDAYRDQLASFAVERLDADDSPWYLQQQALLFLAVLHVQRSEHGSETEPNHAYFALHQILNGEWPQTEEGVPEPSSSVIPLVMIAYRITGDTDKCALLLVDWFGRSQPSEIAQQIGAFLVEEAGLLKTTLDRLPRSSKAQWSTFCEETGYLPSAKSKRWKPVARVSNTLLDMLSAESNPFQQETAALRLAKEIVKKWGTSQERSASGNGILTPSRIEVRCDLWKSLADPTARILESEFRMIIRQPTGALDERFQVPKWCQSGQRWKMEVGQIVRAAILGQADYSRVFWAAPTLQGIRRYRGTGTSCFKRKHGLVNARSALGDRLLPISPWMTELLTRLLVWPGTHAPRELVSLGEDFTDRQLIHCIDQRIRKLAQTYCRLSQMPLYTFPVREVSPSTVSGSLKIAVVQTALPMSSDFTEADPQLNDPAFRRRHRRHLSSMLRLLLKSLDVRKGYKEEGEHIDLVLLPELAVHVEDVPLLERFADSAKCMVFCGLVFHPMPRNPEKLINSGLWILPVKTPEGRSLHFIEQGKENLTPNEVKLGIVRYRPCQWLIEARSGREKPWRLTATICYDATDLRLAADVRNVSDAFIVAALNQDIGTFDTMVSALHYHMYQHIVLVNSAEFGGSTAQAPYKDHYRKVIVHHHGTDQPVVSVIDLDMSCFRTLGQDKGTGDDKPSKPSTKSPPAGFGR